MKTIPQLQFTRLSAAWLRETGALRLRGTCLAVLAALAFVSILTTGLILLTPGARGPTANESVTLVTGDTMRTAAVPAGGKALEGDDATAHLKEQGHYESLMQAVQAARYAVETVKATPDTAPAGECYAGNPAQGLRCWFRAEGLELQPSGAPTCFGTRIGAMNRVGTRSTVSHYSPRAKRPPQTVRRNIPTHPDLSGHGFWAGNCAQVKSRTEWNPSLPKRGVRFMESGNVLAGAVRDREPSGHGRRSSACWMIRRSAPTDVGGYLGHGKDDDEAFGCDSTTLW